MHSEHCVHGREWLEAAGQLQTDPGSGAYSSQPTFAKSGIYPFIPNIGLKRALPQYLWSAGRLIGARVIVGCFPVFLAGGSVVWFSHQARASAAGDIPAADQALFCGPQPGGCGRQCHLKHPSITSHGDSARLLFFWYLSDRAGFPAGKLRRWTFRLFWWNQA